jgi:predicted RNA methylase
LCAALISGQQHAPDVAFAPTAVAVVETMLTAADVGPTDVVYDLGSGDGRIVILAARKYGAHAVGVEIDPALVKASRQKAIDNGVADKVSFVEGDLFATDISKATVVTLYLWPSLNSRLESKLRQELRPGTRIVSNSFGIGHWRPDKTVRAPDGTEVLMWTVPRPPARTPDVPFSPTPETVAYEMLALAKVTAGDVVYDLGSGDGRIPIYAAQKYGARGIGVELDPRLVEISRQVARDSELTNRVSFIEADLFTTAISDASVVTLFLSADVNAKLEGKLRALRPGTRIVSRQFVIGTWAPDKTVRASDGSTLYLWTIPNQ